MNATKREFGMPFRTLPLRLRQRWWEWTCYGKHPATNELMWTIEAINLEAAESLEAKFKSQKNSCEMQDPRPDGLR